MFFSGFFGGFERNDFAAFPDSFRVGTFSPRPGGAKCVQTNSRILHHFGNSKPEEATERSEANQNSL